MVALQKQWVSLPHLYSTSYLKLVFKGPTSHYFWSLKYPFYWNTVRWKEWVLVLESLNFQPNGTSLWHRNGLFKLGLHFHFPIAWGRAGHSEQGRARGLSGQETWTAVLTLPFLIFSQCLGTLGEEKTYPVSRQGVEEMTGEEGPSRGETTGKFWRLLSQNLWNTAPAGEGISQARCLENKVHRHQWRGFPHLGLTAVIYFTYFSTCLLSASSMWQDINSMCVCLVAQLYPTLCDPMDYIPAQLLCPWGFSRQEYYPPPRDLPNPATKPRFTALSLQYTDFQIHCLGLSFGEKIPKTVVTSISSLMMKSATSE